MDTVDESFNEDLTLKINVTKTKVHVCRRKSMARDHIKLRGN